jgi:hypothetical protein
LISAVRGATDRLMAGIVEVIRQASALPHRRVRKTVIVRRSAGGDGPAGAGVH